MDYETTPFTDRANIQAMLDVEAALARAQEKIGLIPQGVAAQIERVCDASLYDHSRLASEAAEAGNLAIPMVKAMIAKLPDEAKRCVHWGVTSQDIIDTGLVQQAKTALATIEQQLVQLADALAHQASHHRGTLMPGRTWLQHALPITFGLKAAGWLDAVTRHRVRLADLRRTSLVLQLGGAVGTLASLGPSGPALIKALAKDLDLPAPALPWHSQRDRMAGIATDLGLLVGTLGKIARDISLMMQTEVAEAFEPAAAGRGGSSTMPHKRNPVLCAAILASAIKVPGLVATMLSAQIHEHERAAGAWTAEWTTLPQIIAEATGALARAIELIEGLEIDAARMRANLDLTRGLIFAEAAMMALAPALGRYEAHVLLEDLSRRAIAERTTLQDTLLQSDAVIAHLSAEQIKAIFDPAAYLGSTTHFIDAALAAHRAMTDNR